MDGKTRNITRFAAMFQNKLHVFAARFTEALDGTVNRIIHYPVNKFKGEPPGGGRVLPYMGYMGMCRCEGYGFQAVSSRIGYINQSIWL